MVQTRWILRAKRLQVQRLELRLRHESWFEDVLKNLGRPFAVERHWHLFVYFFSRSISITRKAKAKFPEISHTMRDERVGTKFKETVQYVLSYDK
jgi:hypothetical protein